MYYKYILLCGLTEEVLKLLSLVLFETTELIDLVYKLFSSSNNKIIGWLDLFCIGHSHSSDAEILFSHLCPIDEGQPGFDGTKHIDLSLSSEK
jgi:hypothetical protein